MPASLNRVVLIGNLTRDPELRYLTTGQAVGNFSIAINRNFTMQTGEKREEVTYVRIVVWAKRAEICNEYLKNGNPVCIEGRLQSRSWEAQDGTKRSTIEVIADNVQFLSSGRGAPRANAEEAPPISEAPASEMPVDVPPVGDAPVTQDSEEVPF
jgi:single-strand DNA-binding protein